MAVAAIMLLVMFVSVTGCDNSNLLMPTITPLWIVVAGVSVFLSVPSIHRSNFF